MKRNKKKIIITGGSGRFGQILKNEKTNYELFFPTKKELDILNEKSISHYIQKVKPKYFIHLAGLSRPMKIHETDIKKSIDLNIIGTANVTKECEKNRIKLIYFSTNYVYPGLVGNYKEDDSLLPVNNYAWSKLGGEASVQLYKNSLILRVCMTEKPFVHKRAFSNIKTSFAYHDEIAKILFKILKYNGIINIGGKSQSIYSFAKKENRNIERAYLSKKKNIGIPANSSINLAKIKKILKNNE